jgi:GcrA cell cycle regulator
MAPVPKAQSPPNHHSSGVFDRSTAERNAAIIRHWKFGLTQTGIGRLMGISRSIVAGVLTRAREDGLIGRLELEDAARRKANWANAHEKRQLVQGGRQALQLVGPRDCRFPIGTPGKPGFRFCRRPRHGDGPYCLHHAGLCYAKAGAAE